MDSDELEFDHDQDVHPSVQNGSWVEERKFVLSELQRIARGLHATRNDVHAHRLTVLAEFARLENKLTKITVWQTVILAAAAFIAKWIFKV